MSNRPSHADVIEVVCSQILNLSIQILPARPLRSDARLIEDLGLDSLRLMDLALALEAELGLGELAIQDLLDAHARAGTSLTVEGLAAACLAASCSLDVRVR